MSPPGIEGGEDTYPLPDDVRAHYDRRRPPNGEIIHRIEALEKRHEKTHELLLKLLSRFGIDDPDDPKAFRQLEKEHDFARVGRSFCEQVGYKFLWAVGAIIVMTVALNSQVLVDFFKK